MAQRPERYGKRMSELRDPMPPVYQRPGDEWAKAACGCWAGWDGHEWLVTASSFLCTHRQGDHIDGGPPADGKTIYERRTDV